MNEFYDEPSPFAKVRFKCPACGFRQSNAPDETCPKCIVDGIENMIHDFTGMPRGAFERARKAQGQTAGQHARWDAGAGAYVPQPTAALSPDAEMLRRLIYLCHPDKHANSQASQIATRYLLDLKARVK